jgi:hypothetical protein
MVNYSSGCWVVERCGAGQVYSLGTKSGRLNPLGKAPESVCDHSLAPPFYIIPKYAENRTHSSQNRNRAALVCAT